MENKPPTDNPTPPTSSDTSTPSQSDSTPPKSSDTPKPESESSSSSTPPSSDVHKEDEHKEPTKPKSMMMVGTIIGFIIVAAIAFFAGRVTAPQVASVVPTAAPQPTAVQEQVQPTQATQTPSQEPQKESSQGGQMHP
jgi:hypothetical protein